MSKDRFVNFSVKNNVENNPLFCNLWLDSLMTFLKGAPHTSWVQDQGIKVLQLHDTFI